MDLRGPTYKEKEGKGNRAGKERQGWGEKGTGGENKGNGEGGNYLPHRCFKTLAAL